MKKAFHLNKANGGVVWKKISLIHLCGNSCNMGGGMLKIFGRA